MNSARELSIGYLRSHPEGAVSVLEALAPNDAGAFLKEVPDDIASRALEVMQPLTAAAILPTLTRKKAATLILAMNTPSRSRVLRLLDGGLMKSIMGQMPERAARNLARYLSYPEGSAGAWMSSDMAVFDRSVTVRDCLAQLRTLPDTLRGAAFVVEKERRLIGVVDIARLLAASDDSGIDVAVRTDIKRLSPFARLVSIMALPAWDTALFLPVVDSRGQLLGALHFDALREGMKSEQRTEAERPMSQVLFHMAEALLVCAAGVLQAPSGKAVLSRSTGTTEV